MKFLFVCTLILLSWNEIMYIDSDGDDNDSCGSSAESACQSFAYAFSRASSNELLDFVFVGGKFYVEQSVVVGGFFYSFF
jgi:hypothetical protein